MLNINGASYSSLFQNSTRWNGFIALPILAKLYGNEGVALVAIIMAILVPVANIVNVAVIARNAGARQLTYRQTVYVVFRNPFIWATAIGLAINLTGLPIYEPMMTGLHMLGGAAIGTGLLMVGAGLHAEEARRPSPAVWLGTGLKLLGMPVIVLRLDHDFGVTGPAVVACLVCAGVPTAMSAYVLARQMGGDATLVATTVTLQTLLSVITIPLLIIFAESVQMNAFIALFPVFIVILLGYLLRRSRFIDDQPLAGRRPDLLLRAFPGHHLQGDRRRRFLAHSGVEHGGGHDAGDLHHVRSAPRHPSMALPRPRHGRPRLHQPLSGRNALAYLHRLAIIPIYFGNEAIALGGLSAAAMIPLLNVVNVAVLAHYASGRKPTARDVVALGCEEPLRSLLGRRRPVQIHRPPLARSRLHRSGHDRPRLAGLGSSGGRRRPEARPGGRRKAPGHCGDGAEAAADAACSPAGCGFWG